MPLIDHLDHLVVTCTDPDATVDFYPRVLGMRLDTSKEGHRSFHFGHQKLNLHVRGHEFDPKAHLPVPGAIDVCFIAAVPLDEVIAHLTACGCPIVDGPVERTGATGPIRSVYVRDPDLNLIELSQPV